jgi:hypothetical protein
MARRRSRDHYADSKQEGFNDRNEIYRNRSYYGSESGYGRPEHYNRFGEQESRYGLIYDSGRGRYNADYGDGYASRNRSHDRDWDNGRNTYWRERYHHQGHPDAPKEDLAGKIKHAWSHWWNDEKQSDRNSHRRGYSSNYRDD